MTPTSLPKKSDNRFQIKAEKKKVHPTGERGKVKSAGKQKEFEEKSKLLGRKRGGKALL